MQITNVISDKMKILEKETMVFLDNGRQREDLMALYSDIRSQIRTSSPDMENIIYEYAALLQEELALYCPHKAYEAGAVSGASLKSDGEQKELFFKQFLRRVELDPESKKIHSTVQHEYDIINGLLGDAPGLIDDFTELYRKCYGFIQEKIDVFFGMGYAATYSEY